MKLGSFPLHEISTVALEPMHRGIFLCRDQIYLRSNHSTFTANFPLDGDERFVEYEVQPVHKTAIPIPVKRLEISLTGLPFRIDPQMIVEGDPLRWLCGWLVVTSAGPCISVLVKGRGAERICYLAKLDGFSLIHHEDADQKSIWFRDWHLFGITSADERFEIPKGVPSDLSSVRG